jgi:cell division protein FtsX
MAGNPLTDPEWATDLADTVERVVGQVRERATTPVVHVARGVVYGLLAGLLGLVAFTLLLIGFMRALQSLLDIGLDHDQSVYLSYLIVGGILCIAGALCLWRRRPSPDQ